MGKFTTTAVNPQVYTWRQLQTFIEQNMPRERGRANAIATPSTHLAFQSESQRLDVSVGSSQPEWSDIVFLDAKLAGFDSRSHLILSVNRENGNKGSLWFQHYFDRPESESEVDQCIDSRYEPDARVPLADLLEDDVCGSVGCDPGVSLDIYSSLHREIGRVIEESRKK